MASRFVRSGSWKGCVHGTNSSPGSLLYSHPSPSQAKRRTGDGIIPFPKCQRFSQSGSANLDERVEGTKYTDKYICVGPPRDSHRFRERSPGGSRLVGNQLEAQHTERHLEISFWSVSVDKTGGVAILLDPREHQVSQRLHSEMCLKKGDGSCC